MKLIICEKPSLARNIVNALPGKQEKKNGYYEVDDYIVRKRNRNGHWTTCRFFRRVFSSG